MTWMLIVSVWSCGFSSCSEERVGQPIIYQSSEVCLTAATIWIKAKSTHLAVCLPVEGEKH